MLELYNGLRLREDIWITKMDPWDRQADFDVLHLWGLEQANYNNAYWAKRSGKKVVMTALIGQTGGVLEKLRFMTSKRIGNVRFLLKVLENIDALVVVNELEALKAIKYFKLPKEKVHIVPNMITREALATINEKAKKEVHFEQYFFCAGNISEKKKPAPAGAGSCRS